MLSRFTAADSPKRPSLCGLGIDHLGLLRHRERRESRNVAANQIGLMGNSSLLVQNVYQVFRGFRVVHEAELLDEVLFQRHIFFAARKGHQIVCIVGEEEGLSSSTFCLRIRILLVSFHESRRGRHATCNPKVADCLAP